MPELKVQTNWPLQSFPISWPKKMGCLSLAYFHVYWRLHEAQGNTMQFHNKQGKYDDEVLEDNHDVSSICREARNGEDDDIGVHCEWVEMASKRRPNRTW